MSRSSSAVVDSKVVEMSLDNKNFEQNATVSIATLKKLQEALDFSNSTDGLDKVNSSVKKVKFDPILNGLEQAKNGFSALEAVAFGAFANIGAKVSDLGIRITTTIPRQILQGGKNRAINLQNAKHQMEGLAEQGLGYGWDDNLTELGIKITKFSEKEQELIDKGQEIKETVGADVDYAVTGTAFGLDEAAGVAGQLMASGVQAGDDLRTALRSISGVATQAGEGYSEIGHIYTTIASNGRLMGEQLTQLSYHNVNATATLARHLGKTEEEIREMVHDGEINFHTFAEAMDEAFGEHSQKANETFEGAFTNVKANLSRIGEMFASPVYDNLRKVLASLIPVLKVVKTNLEPLAAGFTKVADAVGNTISKGLDIVAEALGGTPAKVTEAADETAEAANKALSDMETIQKTAIDVIRGDYGNGMARVNALTEAGFDAEKVQAYVNKIHELTGGTWDLNDAVLAQADAYFGDYQALAKLSDEDLKAAGMSDEDIANLRESAKAMEEVAEKTKLSSEEIGELDTRTRFLYGLQNILGGLSTIFGRIGETISSKFAGFSLSDFNPIEFLSTKFLELGQAFNTFATEHADDIAGIFNGIISAAMGLWDVLHLVGGVVWNVLSGVFSAFGTSILGFAGKVGNLVGALRDWFAENQIIKRSLDWIRTTVENVTTKVKDFFDGFIKMPAFQNGLKKIKNGFKDTFEKLPKHFEGTKKAFSDFKDRVKEMGGIRLDNIVTIFKDFKDNVLGQFLSFEPFQKIKEGVVNIVTTVRSKMEEMSYDAEGNETTFGKVYHTLGAGFDWVADKVTKAKEKIKGWWEEYDIGDFLSKQWLNFSMGLEMLGSHLISFFKGLPGVIGDFWSQVMDSGGFSFDNLGNIFEIFKNTIGQYFKDFHGFDGLKAAFATLARDGKAKLKEMGFDVDEWKDKIVAWKDKIVDTIMGIPDAIANFSLPDAFQKLMNFLTGSESEAAEQGAEGVGKSVESMNNTITSSMDKRFMSTAMPIVSFFSEDVAKEIQENADSMDETTKGFFGKTLGHYMPGIAAVLDKVMATIGETFVNVFTNLKEAFGELEPGWLKEVLNNLLAFGALVVLGKVAWSVASFVSAWGAEKKANAKNVDANAWLKKAAAIAIVAGVIVGLAQMKIADLIKGGAAVAVIALVLGGIDVAIGKLKKGAKNDLGDSLLRMAGAIAIIAALAVILSFIDFWMLLEGLGKVLLIAGLLWLVSLAFKLLDKISPANVGKGLKEMAITFAIMAALAVVLGLISWDVFKEGAIKLGIIAAILVVTLGAIAAINKKLGRAQTALRGLAVMFGVLTACVVVLGLIPVDTLEQGLWGLLAVAGIIVGTMIVLAVVQKYLGPVTSTVRGLAILFGVMAGALVVLSFMDPDSLRLAMEAMALMGGLAAILTIVASKFKVDTKDIFKMVGIMAALAAIVTVVAWITDEFDISANLETFESLSLMMIAMAACMVLVAVAAKIAAGAAAGFGTLLTLLGIVALVVIAVGAVAWALGALDENFGAGSMIDKGLEILKKIVTGIADIVVSFFTTGIQTALDALPKMADSIVDFMDHLSKINDVPFPDLGKCGAAILAFFGAEIMGAIAGVLDWILGDHMTNGMARLPGMADSLVTFMEHLGKLNDVTVPGLGRFGIAILAFVGTEIMGAIASALDMIMGDQMSAGMARLPGMADSLVDFMDALGGLNDVKSVRLGRFASSIAYFFGTEIMGAISAFLEKGLGDSMTAGMNRLPGMARKMVSFYTELTALNDLPYVSFGRFTSLIASVVACDFTGLVTAIGDKAVEALSGQEGRGMMDTFTEDLHNLSSAISDWATEMQNLDGVTLDMTPIQDAITAVEDANEAGFKSSLMTAIKNFFTDKDTTTMEDFSSDVKLLGQTMADFEDEFGSVKVNVDKDGIQDLTESLEIVKGAEDGGLVGLITGFFGGDVTEDLENFKKQVPLLGEALSAFNGALDEDIDPERITAAAEAAKYISEFLSITSGYVYGTDFLSLAEFLKTDLGPAINDFVSSITNLDNLSSIGESLEQISTGMNTLSTLTFDSGDIIDASVVEMFTGNVDTIKSMIEGLTGMDTSGVDKFTSAIDSINGVDLEAAGSNINKKKAEGAGKDGAQAGIDAAKNAFSSDTSVAAAAGGMVTSALSSISAQSGDFQSEGRNLAVQLAAGIIMAKSSVQSAAKGAGDAATGALKGAKSDAKSLGKDFSSGYAAGITEHTPFVTSAVRAVVEAAKRAAQQAQNSHSPSKDTYKYGLWFVQGYRNAIRDNMDLPAAEAGNMTRKTVAAMGESLRTVEAMLEETDAYNPTITPIMDLSNVENGANALSSLLDTSPILGANLGTIANNTSAMRQRTSMSDLLTAMEDLGTVIGNARSVNNYNVNGVTYDDGSNVSLAVGELIRAVEVDRRA